MACRKLAILSTDAALANKMLQKVLHHAKRGTLLRAVLRKLGLARVPAATPDHYHGATARNYLKKRLKQEMWHREQSIVKELLVAIPDGSTVLDVAFGTGRFVDMYLEKEMSVYGIDISNDMLAEAREALGASYDRCHIHLGSADSLPYEDGFFDLVMCFRFFGLIPFGMARRVLSEIHRVSKRTVIIRVPVRKSTAPPLPPLKDEEAVQGRLYESELTALFARFGFAVQDQRLISESESVRYLVYVINKCIVPAMSEPAP
jgi:ubiquinone/menaquinone biosynthesis C-methylase UbiE